MDNSTPQLHTEMPAWITGLTYVSALVVGAVLIVVGHTAPVEATGDIAPFLVDYERVFARRS